MKSKRFFLLIIPVITLILEALPYGAVLTFANPDGEPTRKTFSCFSLIPFGYANFAPFITAIITVLIFAFIVAYLIAKKEFICKELKGLLAVAVALSLCPLGFGLERFSFVAALISVSLAAELALFLYIKPNRKPR